MRRGVALAALRWLARPQAGAQRSERSVAVSQAVHALRELPTCWVTRPLPRNFNHQARPSTDNPRYAMDAKSRTNAMATTHGRAGAEATTPQPTTRAEQPAAQPTSPF